MPVRKCRWEHFDDVFSYCQKTLKIKSGADWATRDFKSFQSAHFDSLVIPVLVKLNLFSPQNSVSGGCGPVCREWSSGDWLVFIRSNFGSVSVLMRSSPEIYRNLTRSKSVYGEVKNAMGEKVFSDWKSRNDDDIVTFLSDGNFYSFSEVPGGLKTHIYIIRPHLKEEAKDIFKTNRKKRQESGLKRTTWTLKKVIKIIESLSVDNIMDCRKKNFKLFRVLTSESKKSKKILQGIVDLGLWTEADCCRQEYDLKRVALTPFQIAEYFYGKLKIKQAGESVALSVIDRGLSTHLTDKRIHLEVKTYICLRLGHLSERKMEYLYQWTVCDYMAFFKVMEMSCTDIKEQLPDLVRFFRCNNISIKTGEDGHVIAFCNACYHV